MAYLSPTQLAAVAEAGGFQGNEKRIAIAVAYAESRANPAAHHVTSREDSRGLWQINVKAWPQYRDRNLYDPVTNARTTHEISTAGRKWNYWSNE